MKPFFLFDFFQTGGAKTSLAAGMILTGLGLTVLFFPELLRVLIGGFFIAAGIPFLAYGLRTLAFLNRRGGPGGKDEPPVIFP